MYPAKIIVSVLGIVSKGTHKQDVVGWCCLGHGVDEIERVGIGPLDMVKKEYDDVSATRNSQQYTPPQLLEPSEGLCGRSHVLCLATSDGLGVLDRSYPKQLSQSMDGIAQDCGIAIDHAFEAVVEAFNSVWPGFQDVLTELVGCSNNGSKRLVVDELVVLAGPEEGLDGITTLVFGPLFQCLHDG